MITHERHGSGPPVLCLHGWPGGVSDYRDVVPRLTGSAEVVVPHLVGFGDSFAPGDASRPVADFGRDAQVGALVDLMAGLDLAPAVVVGYDVGATVAVALARVAPQRVRALVLGNTVHPHDAAFALDDDHRVEFWYQDFHQLAMAAALVDGSRAAVATYLGHFWSHWGHASGAALSDEVIDAYARPGAFTASLGWYRSGSATLATALAMRGADPPSPIDLPATVLWGERDPLYPLRMADGLPQLLHRVDMRLLPDVGHFTPLEAAGEMADAVLAHLR